MTSNSVSFSTRFMYANRMELLTAEFGYLLQSALLKYCRPIEPSAQNSVSIPPRTQPWYISYRDYAEECSITPNRVNRATHPLFSIEHSFSLLPSGFVPCKYLFLLYTNGIHHCSQIRISTHRFVAQVFHPAVEIGCFPQQRGNVFRSGQIEVRSRPGGVRGFDIAIFAAGRKIYLARCVLGCCRLGLFGCLSMWSVYWKTIQSERERVKTWVKNGWNKSYQKICRLSAPSSVR